MLELHVLLVQAPPFSVPPHAQPVVPTSHLHEPSRQSSLFSGQQSALLPHKDCTIASPLQNPFAPQLHHPYVELQTSDAHCEFSRQVSPSAT